MEWIISEFLKLLFQPPVLILFALAVAGLSLMLRDSADHRDRVNMEWRVRESVYRQIADVSDESIARARRRFYERHHLKEPRSK